MRARRIIRVQSPAPLGEVTVPPAALTGRAETDMARAIAHSVAGPTAEIEAPGTAEMSGRSRQTFPSASQGARLGSLGMIMERVRRLG